MNKRRKCLFLLFLVGLLVLVTTIMRPSPAYPGSIGWYDYVDNNLSDVDASADKGTHSNFTAQQYGPDSIHDTLTEENTGGSATWSNNTQPANLILETDPDISGSAGTYETYGLTNLASDDSTYGGGDVQDCGIVNDPQEVSLIMEFDYSGLGISGSDISTLRFEAEVYFIGGAGRTPMNDPWEMANTFYNGSVDIYNWDSDSWETLGTAFITSPNDLSLWDNTGDTNPERPLVRFKDSGLSDNHMNSSGYLRIRIQMTGVFQGTPFDGCSVIDYVDVDLQYGEENYGLDLEVQWINANYTQNYEELCIYGGTMGSEDIQVDVWNGSSWHNLFIDLLNGWNNVSVTNYLVSPTFTIRFRGGTETGDSSQDSWEIDCTLLHTWGFTPIANFSYTPENPYTGQLVSFNASESFDPDGSIVSYSWNFGDGANGTGELASHIYVDNGTYTVTLTVTDNDDLSDTTSTEVTVLNRPPICLFTESAEIVYTGENITFNASESYDPDGSITSYFWDFGDETNTTGEIVDHSYADDGTYTVTLTVTDDDGAIASLSANKTVLNKSPVTIFSESATTVLTGEIISFNASDSYDSDGYIASYFWDFGDGTNASGVLVDHSYPDDGNYTVTLTVIDDDEATMSTNATKTVLNRSPVALFTESAEIVLTGEVILFNASDSYDPDGSIVTYFWDFGDGTNTTEIIVDHIYADDGIYNVTLTVYDDDGATASTSTTKIVLNRLPVALFTESAETVYTGQTIVFNATECYDSDGYIASYFWDFGDGMNSTGVVVEHAYFDDGNYTVVLMVTDDDGANSTANATKTVLNRSPVALFTESAEIVLTGEVILFNASDSYDPDGSITSYFWDFGDGTNASGVIVEHAYPDNGNYTVTLILMDNNGAADTATATKTVLNRSPVALFTESAETAYVNETIMFNASGSYDSDGYIASYFWDFGDGTNASGVIVEHAYSTNGTFVVTLTVTDDDNALDSAQATKTIIAQEFIHDVAVLDVIPSATEVYNRLSVNVTIVVMNKGTATETFNVTLYCALIHGWHLIEVDAYPVWYSDGKDLGDFLLLASVTVPTGNPVLTFDTKYRIEHLYDYGFVQVSRDGGITWHSLENTYTTYEHAPEADPNIITELPGLTGTSEGWPGWTTMTFNLTDYAGETIMLGFRYMTDWATTNEGWYIDNIRISGNVIPNQLFEQADPPPLTAIQTQTIINLTPGSQRTLQYTWNTTNTTVGRFSMSATAKTVVGETETNDNTYLDGVVEVKCNPDINNDGVVDLFDLTILGTAWDSGPGDPNWNEWADLDCDGHIFLYDLTMLGSHWDELIP